MNTETAMKNFDTGNQLLQEGKLQEAIASYCDAIKLNPTNSWFHHQMAEALAKLGQFDQAVTAYRDAIELNPDFSWSYHHLGDALTQQQQWEESAEAFRKAIELNPEHYGSYVGLGKSLAKLGQLDEAIAAYRRAKELNPDADWINFPLAEVLEQKKQSDLALAIASCQRAIELNPDDLQAYHKFLEIQPENCNVWFQLAETLAKQNQLEEAIAAYRQAQELNPDADWINFPLSEVLEQKKQSDLALAIASYQRAIELNPDDLQAYHKLLEIQPENCNVWFQLAETLAKQNQLEEAIAAYRQAIQLIDSEKQTTSNLNPQDERELMIAHYQQAIKDNPDSISDYYKFLELQPDNQEVLLQLAEALVRQEQMEEAIAAYRQLLELSPREEYYHPLGELLVKQEKWDEAIIVYRRAIELNPESYLYYHQLGEVIYNRVMQNPESFFVDYKIAELPHKEYQLFDPELPELCFLNDEKFFQATSHLDDQTYVIEIYRVYLRREPSDFEKENGINWLRAVNNRLLGLVTSRQELPELQSLFRHSITSVCLQESINAYRKATELNYNHYKSQYRIAEILTKQGKSNEVAVTLCYDLSLHLAEQGSLNEAVEFFSLLQEINQHNLGWICEYVWNALNNINHFNENSVYNKVRIQQKDALEHFMQKSHYKTIHLYALTEEDKAFLKQLGLSITNLEIISKDNIALEEIYINHFSFAKTQLTRKVARNPQYGSDYWHTGMYLQQSIVETGYVYAVCPISGRVLRSNQSFFVFPSFFYRFVGEEVFYLLVGDWYSGRTCVYFPRWDLIIRLFPADHIYHEDSINLFRAYSVTNWQSFKSYISTPKKEVVAIIGDLMNNLTHYMWEVAGFQYLDDNNILDKVDKVFVGPYDFLKIGDLFPEITQDKIVVFDNSINLYQSIIENNYCAVRLVECFIREKLADRIYQASLKKCSTLFLEEVEKSTQNFPVLWITIRSRRTWNSQVQGIANIINNLSVDFPNLSIIFDGWSRTEKGSEEEELRIATEMDIMEKILAIIPPEINTYNTIGRMTYEKAVWVHAIDLYISPIGAGLSFTVWLVNKPGVAHGHTMFTASETQSSSYHNCRENARERPVLLPLDKITDEDNSFWFTRNYDCDWQAIYDEVVKIINGLSKKDIGAGIN